MKIYKKKRKDHRGDVPFSTSNSTVRTILASPVLAGGAAASLNPVSSLSPSLLYTPPSRRVEYWFVVPVKLGWSLRGIDPRG